jgi:Zn finger protein HypA/HybF involved in hydrogenase expression
MRGLPVAEAIVNSIISSIEGKFGKVRGIDVEMEPGSIIDAEKRELCFATASKGTEIEDVKINIELKPGTVECRDCGKVEQKTRVDHLPTCPSCYGTDLKIDEVGRVLKDIGFEEVER